MEEIATGKYKLVPVFVEWDGVWIKTAEGYPVPVEKIDGIQRFDIPENLLRQANFNRRDRRGEKGEKAEQLAYVMLKRGLIPAALQIGRRGPNEERLGIDIRLEPATVQVKCDYRGGDKHLGGTGNLFIQIKECNPGKEYSRTSPDEFYGDELISSDVSDVVRSEEIKQLRLFGDRRKSGGVENY